MSPFTFSMLAFLCSNLVPSLSVQCSTDYGELIVHPNGRDYPACGSSIDNACGTIYYTSLHNNCTSCWIMQIYGQNATQIEVYYNESTIEYHPCVIVPISSCTYIKMQFDEESVQSMMDWYPPICHTISTSATFNNHTQKYLLQFDGTLTVNNLHIDNIMFNPPIFPNGIYHSEPSYSSFACYEGCSFENITAVCTDQQYNSIIYAPSFITSNAIFINISYTINADYNCISSSFINTTVQQRFNSIRYSELSNIVMDHNFFTTQMGVISIDNAIISDVHCKHAFIQDIIPDNPMLKLPQTAITASNITNFYGTALYVALSLEYATELLVTDSYISYVATNNYNYNTTSALFNIGDGHLLLQNAIIEYHYDLIENCDANYYVSDDFLSDFVVAQCVNPMPLMISFGDTMIDGVQLYFEVNYIEYEETFYNNTNVDDYVVNYRFARDDVYRPGLIINYGDMQCINLTVSPYTFHDIFILDQGILFSIESFSVTHHSDNNLLTSNYLYYYTANDISHSDSDDIPTKQFTNCALGSVKDTVIVIDAIQQLITLSVDNCSICNALKAIIVSIFSSGSTTSAVTLDSTNFKNIGSHYLDLYGYYYGYNTSSFNIVYSGSYGTIYTEKTNSPIYIHRVFNTTVRNCILDFYNNYHLLNMVDVDIANLYSNTFSTGTIDGNSFLYDDVLMMNQSLVNIYKNSIYYSSIPYHSIISNIFSNTSYLNDNTPALSISNTKKTCLTGNIFYNYGLYTKDTNIISCYRPDARVISQFCGHKNETVCCNHIGGLIPEFSNLFGYFYLDDKPYVNPIQSSSWWFSSEVILDNIVFVLNGNRDSIFYPEVDVITSEVDVLFYDIEIVHRNKHNISIVSDYSDNINRNCVVGCNQQLSAYDEVINDWSVDYFKQIFMVCSVNDYTLNSSTEWVTHSIPSYIDLIPINSNTYKYFPGQFMTLKMEITDRLHNIIDEYDNTMNTLIVNLYYKNKDLAAGITLDSNNSYTCNDVICVEGLILSDITLNDIGTVIIYGQETSQTLNVFDLSLNVTHCTLGYKISSTGLYCTECPKGEFRLTRSSNSLVCDSCDEHINEGVSCDGGNSIIIQEDYWMDIIQDDDNHSVIITGFCPQEYCCNNDNGCNYYQNTHNESYSGSKLCASYRNFNVPLCGSCIYGYSQSINSNPCVYCDRHQFWYLFYPIGLALFCSVCLIVSTATKVEDNHSKQEDDEKAKISGCKKWIKETKKKISAQQAQILMSKQMNGIMILKIISYYQQSVAQILLSSVVIVNVSTLSSLFNLSIISTTGNNQGLCFIKGLTSKGKILTDLLVTLFIIFIIGSMYIISKFKDIKIKNRIPNFPKIYIAFLLLAIGQILSILFQLLNCQSVGHGDHQKYVHFYFGIEECYRVTWILSFLSLIAIILVFVILFFVIKKMDTSLRENEEKNVLASMTKAYKKEYYYWEFVILCRRILVSFLSITFGNDYSKWVLILALLICLGMQTKYKPFLYKENNQMEWILLSCLILIISVLLVSSSLQFHVVIISLLIIFPFLLQIYFQFAFCSQFKDTETDSYTAMQMTNIHTATDDHHDVEKTYAE